MKHKITETLYLFSGILYGIQEKDYDQTKHEGFSEYQELPISLEGDLVGRYTKGFFLPERTYLVMMHDENPPSVVATGWDVSPIYISSGTTLYSGADLLWVTETHGNFVTELLLKIQG